MGAEILRECSLPTVCHITGVTCQVSGVRCQVSDVMCQVSRVTCHIFFLQIGEASRGRVFYQQGLPRLVYIQTTQQLNVNLWVVRIYTAVLLSNRSFQKFSLLKV